jgi:hypothetical protein
MHQASPHPTNGSARRALEKIAVMGLRGLIIVGLTTALTATRAGQQARHYSSKVKSSSSSALSRGLAKLTNMHS